MWFHKKEELTLHFTQISLEIQKFLKDIEFCHLRGDTCSWNLTCSRWASEGLVWQMVMSLEVVVAENRGKKEIQEGIIKSLHIYIWTVTITLIWRQSKIEHIKIYSWFITVLWENGWTSLIFWIVLLCNRGELKKVCLLEDRNSR